jgi:hypothetical protein
MKLNYNDQYKAARSNPEFELFKRQLLRQAGGFGVVYGAEAQQSALINSEEFDGDLYKNQPRNVLQVLRKSVDFAGSAIRLAGVRVRNLTLATVERFQNGNVIRRMLRLSDSALRDIGLDRQQLETLVISGGNLSDYVSGVRNRSFESAESLKVEPRLTLIDCSEFDRINDHNLDRAA